QVLSAHIDFAFDLPRRAETRPLRVGLGDGNSEPRLRLLETGKVHWESLEIGLLLTLHLLEDLLTRSPCLRGHALQCSERWETGRVGGVGVTVTILVDPITADLWRIGMPGRVRVVAIPSDRGI